MPTIIRGGPYFLSIQFTGSSPKNKLLPERRLPKRYHRPVRESLLHGVGWFFPDKPTSLRASISSSRRMNHAEGPSRLLHPLCSKEPILWKRQSPKKFTPIRQTASSHRRCSCFSPFVFDPQHPCSRPKVIRDPAIHPPSLQLRTGNIIVSPCYYQARGSLFINRPAGLVSSLARERIRGVR